MGVAADGFFWVEIFVLQLQPSRSEHVFIILQLFFFFNLNFVTFFSPHFEVFYESVGGHEQLPRERRSRHGLVREANRALMLFLPHGSIAPGRGDASAPKHRMSSLMCHKWQLRCVCVCV